MIDYPLIWLSTLLAGVLFPAISGFRRTGKTLKQRNALLSQGVVTACAVVGGSLFLSFMRVLENSMGHGWGVDGWLLMVAMCYGPSLFLWLVFEIYYRRIAA